MAARQARGRSAPKTRELPKPKELRLKLVKETTGAVRFVEIDEKGNKRVDDDDGALIGIQYMRKAGLADWLGSDDVPPIVNVTLSVPAE